MDLIKCEYVTNAGMDGRECSAIDHNAESETEIMLFMHRERKSLFPRALPREVCLYYLWSDSFFRVPELPQNKNRA